MTNILEQIFQEEKEYQEDLYDKKITRKDFLETYPTICLIEKALNKDPSLYEKIEKLLYAI